MYDNSREPKKKRIGLEKQCDFYHLQRICMKFFELGSVIVHEIAKDLSWMNLLDVLKLIKDVHVLNEG